MRMRCSCRRHRDTACQASSAVKANFLGLCFGWIFLSFLRVGAAKGNVEGSVLDFSFLRVAKGKVEGVTARWSPWVCGVCFTLPTRLVEVAWKTL